MYGLVKTSPVTLDELEVGKGLEFGSGRLVAGNVNDKLVVGAHGLPLSGVPLEAFVEQRLSVVDVGSLLDRLDDRLIVVVDDCVVQSLRGRSKREKRHEKRGEGAYGPR